MLENLNHPTVEQLQKLKILFLFSEVELNSFSALLEVYEANATDKIIQIGDATAYSLFILNGEAIQLDRDGRHSYISLEKDGFYISQSHLRPSAFTIKAVTKIQYIKILPDDLNRFSHMFEPDADSIDVGYIKQSDEANDLSVHIFQEIMDDKIRVPAMPEISIKVQQLFESDNAEIETLSELIQTDPSLSAKILRVANSALYRGASSVDSIPKAIVRMGMKTLRNQVIIYAVSEMLTMTSHAMQLRMKKLWEESRRVAAFSRILSKNLPSFNAETAQMAGLLSNLGSVAIVQYIQDNYPHSYSETLLDQTITNLRPQINSFLMTKWNLGNELITVAEESHDWFRNNDSKADLCDVVLIARYFSCLSANRKNNLPLLSRLPALQKLKDQGFQMSDSLSFIKESQSEIELIENMLGSI